MSKKSVKNDKGKAGVRPAPGGAAGGGATGIGMDAGGTAAPGAMLVNDDPGPISPFLPPKLKVRDALFELYVARVATIDRYRVPITDRGLPATYRKAFDEAVVALEVYQEMASARNAAEMS